MSANTFESPLPSAVDSQPQAAAAANVPRRLKACLGCREHKLRCKRNEEDPSLDCERCASLGRECIIPEAVRKRRKKDGIGAIAVLERKVDALVATLAERKRHLGDDGDKDWDGMQEDTEPPPQNEQFANTTGTQNISRKRGHSENPNLREILESGSPLASPNNRKRTHPEIPNIISFFVPKPPRTEELFQTDVISRGLVSPEDAEKAFRWFCEVLLPQFPMIVLPEGTKFIDLRRKRPAVALAILFVGGPFVEQEHQKMIQQELLHFYADRIVIRCERDLDLIQALQISVIWYTPADNFQEIKVPQFVNMAASMAVELGISHEEQASTSRLPSASVGTSTRTGYISILSSVETQAERKRAWLVCYILSVVVSMAGRRTNLLRWAPYMDKCISSLENGSNSRADRILCEWARGQHIAEEIGQQFSMDDPSAAVDASDVRVQYILRGFEKQLEQWKSQMPISIQSPTLQLSFNLINLYLHEVVLHVEHNIIDFRAPFVEESIVSPASTKNFQTLTPMQINCLAICISSAKNVLNIFLSFDSKTLNSIPAFNYVRTAYAALILIKIHFIALQSGNRFDGILNVEELGAEAYLQKLTDHMQSVVQGRRLRVASLFSLVTQMLQIWFQKQSQRAFVNPGLGQNNDRNSDYDGSQNLGQESFRGFDTMPYPNMETQTSMDQRDLPDWEQVDFGSLLDTNDGRVFEAAFGWLGFS